MLLQRLITATGLCLTMMSAWSAQATVAVAANFAPTLKVLVAEIEKQTGHQYRLVSASTGGLYAQIRNGAPFDVLLAADQAVPLALERDGLTVAGSRFTYATGTLVLWSANAQGVDAQGQVLKKGQFKRLAIANPKTAPYGAAALAALKQLGLENAVHSRLVQGESVGQTLSFIATGNADLGFVALSQVLKNSQLKSGSMWQVPTHLYPPIRQDAVLLRQAAHNAAALALIAALQSKAGKDLLTAHGYQP
jgi:molybdate transport system substrate-binding protein